MTLTTGVFALHALLGCHALKIEGGLLFLYSQHFPVKAHTVNDGLQAAWELRPQSDFTSAQAD